VEDVLVVHPGLMESYSGFAERCPGTRPYFVVVLPLFLPDEYNLVVRDFAIFNTAAVRHLGFLKGPIFNSR